MKSLRPAAAHFSAPSDGHRIDRNQSMANCHRSRHRAGPSDDPVISKWCRHQRRCRDRQQSFIFLIHELPLLAWFRNKPPIHRITSPHSEPGVQHCAMARCEPTFGVHHSSLKRSSLRYPPGPTNAAEGWLDQYCRLQNSEHWVHDPGAKWKKRFEP